MSIASKLFDETDRYLLKCWCEEFNTTCYTYREPILDSATVDLIKHMCEALKQDSHVFILSVEILVQYITIQNSRNHAIENYMIVVVCIIFICSKQVGEQSTLRPSVIAKLYTNVTGEDVNVDTVKEVEMCILFVLQYKLPLFSKIDDLKTFLTTYMQHFNLRIDITDICVQILDIIYIYYRRLFYKLKNVYKENEDTLCAFKEIITNRLYLPCGILICCLKLTKLKHFMSIENVLNEISDLCGLHRNHIELLAEYIHNICSSEHITANS